MTDRGEAAPWRDMLGVDLRSLAAFRIGLACLCLFDLAERALDLSAHYTDQGIVPRATLLTEAPQWLVSLHFYSGSWQGQAALFVLAAVAASCLLVGYRTWTATLITYLLTISVQNRNPLLTYGADEAMRVLLFWSLFLPLAARWSVDRRLATPEEPPSPPTILCGGSIALTAQIIFIYLFAALLKSGATWSEGTAVYYALHADRFARPAGQSLLQFPGLLTWATWSVYYVELVVPLFLLCPIYTRVVRLVAIVLLASLHLGMMPLLDVGLWPLVMIVALVSQLPGGVWHRLQRVSAIHRLSDWLSTSCTTWIERLQLRARPLSAMRRCVSWPVSTLAVALAIYTGMWNVAVLDSALPDWPDWLLSPGLVTRLDQRWHLFAPDPMRDDGWLVIDARFADGSSKDLLTGKPPSWEKPPRPPMRDLNNRWQAYQKWLWIQRQDAWVLRSYGNWLCREGNPPEGDDPALVAFRLYYMLEPTPLPGEPPGAIQKILLHEQLCGETGQTRMPPGTSPE